MSILTYDKMVYSWNVFLDDKLIDTVIYPTYYGANDVRIELIENKGYDRKIEVRRNW